MQRYVSPVSTWGSIHYWLGLSSLHRARRGAFISFSACGTTDRATVQSGSSHPCVQAGTRLLTPARRCGRPTQWRPQSRLKSSHRGTSAKISRRAPQAVGRITPTTQRPCALVGPEGSSGSDGAFPEGSIKRAAVAPPSPAPMTAMRLLRFTVRSLYSLRILLGIEI